MRISHHGCGPVGKYCPSKFGWYKQTAFQMKMAINKAGGKYTAIEFDNLIGLTLPKTHNHAIEHGNGGRGQLPRENVDHFSSSQKEIHGPVTPGRLKSPG
jgi:hypothetical protein